MKHSNKSFCCKPLTLLTLIFQKSLKLTYVQAHILYIELGSVICPVYLWKNLSRVAQEANSSFLVTSSGQFKVQ